MIWRFLELFGDWLKVLLRIDVCCFRLKASPRTCFHPATRWRSDSAMSSKVHLLRQKRFLALVIKLRRSVLDSGTSSLLSYRIENPSSSRSTNMGRMLTAAKFFCWMFSGGWILPGQHGCRRSLDARRSSHHLRMPRRLPVYLRWSPRRQR